MTIPSLALMRKAACYSAIACIYALFVCSADAQLRPFVPGVQIVPGAPVQYPQEETPAPARRADLLLVTPASHGSPHCPCPDAPGLIDDGSTGTGTGTSNNNSDDPAEYELPDIANIDSNFASAPQSAVPNAIGDSLGGCGLLMIPYAGGDTFDICPSGGRQFKISHNNNAVPKSRVFYTYNHFDEAIGASIGGNDRRAVDVDSYEFGFEYAFWCDLISLQVNAPMNNTVPSHIQSPLQTLPRDMQLGNVAAALKFVVLQDCRKTISFGLGVEFPTADDIRIDVEDAMANTMHNFTLENEAITLSPFIALTGELSHKTFFNGFVQFAIPTESNNVQNIFTDGAAAPEEFNGNIKQLSLLYVDVSLGNWLYRDCCTGNGVAAIFEVHYTTALSRPNFLGPDPEELGDSAFGYRRHDVLNGTIGLTAFYNKWDFTIASVIPGTERPDRFFNWEVASQINRRF